MRKVVDATGSGFLLLLLDKDEPRLQGPIMARPCKRNIPDFASQIC
jgi:hypothetical protein